MSPLWAVAITVVACALVYWILPPILQVVVYTQQLRRMGLSKKEIGEALRAQARRMQALGVAMRRGCGEQCHQAYCDLDPFGESPHQCHVADCPDRDRDDDEDD